MIINNVCHGQRECVQLFTSTHFNTPFRSHFRKTRILVRNFPMTKLFLLIRSPVWWEKTERRVGEWSIKCPHLRYSSSLTLPLIYSAYLIRYLSIHPDIKLWERYIYFYLTMVIMFISDKKKKKFWHIFKENLWNRNILFLWFKSFKSILSID